MVFVGVQYDYDEMDFYRLYLSDLRLEPIAVSKTPFLGDTGVLEKNEHCPLDAFGGSNPKHFTIRRTSLNCH
ncbi:hypothetical protein ElyMa_001199200 [Elysia marginata]|uniref:Uncharacterized protein n=1 Tax=Elysia marginata TaxID=1093978 RepID=A0AAV4I4Z5_9GAST|nr:hypothetical protein ElyMa_001199200 [Elysia marginata]